MSSRAFGSPTAHAMKHSTANRPATPPVQAFQTQPSPSTPTTQSTHGMNTAIKARKTPTPPVTPTQAWYPTTGHSRLALPIAPVMAPATCRTTVRRTTAVQPMAGCSPAISRSTHPTTQPGTPKARATSPTESGFMPEAPATRPTRRATGFSMALAGTISTTRRSSKTAP